jgi:Cytidylate kinase
MKKGIIVTIDGPSGVGKGTVAREVAKRLGFSYLDTGAMYRAVALFVCRKGIGFNDEEELKELLSQSRITFQNGENSTQRVFLNGEDVTEGIRTPEISRLSSDIATNGIVRLHLRKMQRENREKGNDRNRGKGYGNLCVSRCGFQVLPPCDTR